MGLPGWHRAPARRKSGATAAVTPFGSDRSAASARQWVPVEKAGAQRRLSVRDIRVKGGDEMIEEGANGRRLSEESALEWAQVPACCTVADGRGANERRLRQASSVRGDPRSAAERWRMRSTCV